MNRALVAVGLGLATLLLLGLILIGGGAPLPGDVAITRAVQSAVPYGSGGAVLAKLDDLIWMVAGGVVLALLALRRWSAAAFVLVAAGSGYVLGDYALKPLLGRPRPSAELVQVYADASGAGLPSTTTLCAVLVMGALLYTTRSAAPQRRRLLWAGALAVVALISLARLYAGVHWGSDILASWLLGAGWLGVLAAVDTWRVPRGVAAPTS